MRLIDVNWNPPSSELRKFAGIWFPAFFTLAGTVALIRGTAMPAVMWGVALVVAIAGLFRPPLVRPVYVIWMAMAYPVGWTVSTLLLGLAYYLVMTPLGLALRVCGHDPMERSFDRSAKSYWMPHNPGGETERYFQQL